MPNNFPIDITTKMELKFRDFLMAMKQSLDREKDLDVKKIVPNVDKYVSKIFPHKFRTIVAPKRREFDKALKVFEKITPDKMIQTFGALTALARADINKSSVSQELKVILNSIKKESKYKKVSYYGIVLGIVVVLWAALISTGFKSTVFAILAIFTLMLIGLHKNTEAHGTETKETNTSTTTRSPKSKPSAPKPSFGSDEDIL